MYVSVTNIKKYILRAKRYWIKSKISLRTMLATAGRKCRRILSMNNVPADVFVKCQWQNSQTVSLAYVIYKWFILILLVSIAVASYIRQRVIKPPGYEGPPVIINRWKWFIYLTNWGIMLCIIQAMLSLIILQKRWFERNVPLGGHDYENAELWSVEAESVNTPTICRVYWLTQIVAVDFALVITVVYWTVVYDATIHEMNIVNMLVHGLNAVIMLIEVNLSTQKIHMCHVIFSIASGTVYCIFSAIYYLAGGTDKAGNKTIYPMLDWSRPRVAFMFYFACMTAVIVSHIFVIVLKKMNQLLAKKCLRRVKLSLPK